MAIAVACLGCGSGGDYRVAPVTGKVLVDGEPLTAAKVMFTPVASEGGMMAGKAGLGTVKDGGSFAVSTYGSRDGAVVGDHRVTIIDRKDTPSDGRRLGVRRVRLPDTYTVVSGQDNEFAIELSAQIIKRHATR
ncbi:MAG: hypothetical protein AAF266_09300 [Planctomycetota bacterium]